MSKRINTWIIVTFVVSVATVLALYAVSVDLQRIPGSFLRIYPPHPVVEELSMPIMYDEYYLAGATNSHVYLAHRNTPRHMLQVNRNLRDTAHITLRIDDLNKHKNFRVDVVIDSPYFYFMDGTVPYLYRGDMISWKGENILCDSTYFLSAVPLSTESAALHSYSRVTRENELGKKRYDTRGASLNNDLLQKQIDGAFCVDGQLTYNPYLNRLIYVYRYRNEYMVIDTTMSLHYRAHTLDTFSRARVVFDTVHATGVVRLSAPPPIVNKRFATFRQWLFVQSAVPAKNEVEDRFLKGAVIDVYDLLTHEYRFSFYINDIKGKQMKSFIISNYTLYALFDHTLVRYTLPPRSFSRDDLNNTSQELADIKKYHDYPKKSY